MKKINPNLLKLAEMTYNPSLAKPSLEEEKGPEFIQFNTKINRKDYIQIPNTTILISKEEIYRGKNWRDTHYALAEDGLFMPSPAIFMPYFVSVVEAFNKNKPLLDGESKPIGMKEVEELYKYFTTCYKNGCWTWLDANFRKGNKGLELETEHRVVNGTLIGKTYPLEEYIECHCFVELDFNGQGLPVKKALNQSYRHGGNINFWYPIERYVAWFFANPNIAGLDCQGDTRFSSLSLGVFACANGAMQPISELK